MGAESDKGDCLFGLIDPDEQEVILDVALHTTDELAGEVMRFVCGVYRSGFLKLVQNLFQCCQFRRVLLVAFQVFLELGRQVEGPHATALL